MTHGDDDARSQSIRDGGQRAKKKVQRGRQDKHIYATAVLCEVVSKEEVESKQRDVEGSA